jgi:type IV secretory pathway protease TraF
VGEVVLARDPRAADRLILKRVAEVSEGACTLLGDRPDESTDSRTFGPVPLGNVLARALFRYAPIGRIGWLW